MNAGIKFSLVIVVTFFTYILAGFNPDVSLRAFLVVPQWIILIMMLPKNIYSLLFLITHSLMFIIVIFISIYLSSLYFTIVLFVLIAVSIVFLVMGFDKDDPNHFILYKLKIREMLGEKF